MVVYYYVILKALFLSVFGMADRCALVYSLLLIQIKSSDYFACDKDKCFQDCLLRCRTCLVGLVLPSIVVGSISKVTLKGCLLEYSVINFMYCNLN